MLGHAQARIPISVSWQIDPPSFRARLGAELTEKLSPLEKWSSPLRDHVCIVPPESRFLPFLQLMDSNDQASDFPESGGTGEFLGGKSEGEEKARSKRRAKGVG